MRWASLIGRRERVKLAESKRVSAERGGRPCLQQRCQLKHRERVVCVPDKVCQRKRMQRFCGKASDLVIADIGRCWIMRPLLAWGKSACGGCVGVL